MKSISSETRARIINLRLSGFLPSVVVNKLKEDGKTVTRQTRIYKTYMFSRKMAYEQKSGREKKVSTIHFNFIDKAYEENDELSANDLKKLLNKKFQLNISISTIKSLRKKLGWIKSGHCQAIRPANCTKRLVYAIECIGSGELFNDVVFTDESSVWMQRHSQLCFRRKGQPGKLKPCVKHPYKVHVWAGISRRGKSKLLLFTGIMRKVYNTQ